MNRRRLGRALEAVALYAALFYAAAGVAGWAGFFMTFGKVHAYGPSDATSVIAGFAAFGVAAGAMLLIIHRLLGALVTFAGLAVTIAAYGGWLVTGRAVPVGLDELGLLATMVVGLVLLVRQAQRDEFSL